MTLRIIIIMLFVSVAVSHAQVINISGQVKNGSGTGIEGVTVRLGKAKLSTTTGSNGNFNLTGNLTGIQQPARPAAVKHDNNLFELDNNTLIIHSREQTNVEIKVYDCTGRLVASLGNTTSAKNHAFALPSLSRGIHIFRISMRGNTCMFKAITGPKAQCVPGSSWETASTARLSRTTASVDDALLFTKTGYQLYRLRITNTDTSGIQATLNAWVTGTVSDGEGNSYQTIQYGNQVWTVENLRTTKYNDGSNIGSGCAFYSNKTDAALKKKWGALYTGSVAISGKLAPTGWRVPTDKDWDDLQTYLIANGYNYDGTTDSNKIAKAMCATTDWESFEDWGAPGNDLNSNNISGFSALPGGVHDYSGSFFDQTVLGWWWTSTKMDGTMTYARAIMYTSFDLYKGDRVSMNGFSIRLVKSN